VQLVNLAVSSEKRLLIHHLNEDATSGPDVDRERVGLRTKQNFRRPVPESNHLQREWHYPQKKKKKRKENKKRKQNKKRRRKRRNTNLMSVRADRNTERARQAKVSQLDVSVRVDEEVLRLQIAVNNAA
jgi:hypothetical protein